MMSVFRSMLDLMVPLVLVTPEPTAAQQPANMPETFTGRNASASPDAPELNFRIHSPPAESRTNYRFRDRLPFYGTSDSLATASRLSDRTTFKLASRGDERIRGRETDDRWI